MTAEERKKDRIRGLTQYHVLSIFSLIIMGIGFTALVVTLYLYDTGVKEAIDATRIAKTLSDKAISQHDNITKQVGDQLRQHDEITDALTEQLKQHDFITSGLINVTDINTVILGSVNETVTLLKNRTD